MGAQGTGALQGGSPPWPCLCQGQGRFHRRSDVGRKPYRRNSVCFVPDGVVRRCQGPGALGEVEEEPLKEVGPGSNLGWVSWAQGCLSVGHREPLKILEEGSDQAELAAVTAWTRGLEAQRWWQRPGATWL